MNKNTRDLEYIAYQLDSRFKGPFGFKFGWDGILGLIPGIGDLISSSFSFYILVRAASMGAPPILIARMGLNILIDNVFDVVPVLGWIFDFAWKANNKNVKLLHQFTYDKRKITIQSRIWVILILIVILALFALFIAGGFYLLWTAVTYLQSYIQNLNY